MLKVMCCFFCINTCPHKHVNKHLNIRLNVFSFKYFVKTSFCLFLTFKIKLSKKIILLKMKFITPDGKEIVSLPKSTKIETNQAYCFICKSFLESTNTHDFVQCDCG